MGPLPCEIDRSDNYWISIRFIIHGCCWLLVWDIVSTIIYPFIEAMLIKSYATTPGKALMGFRVLTEDGKKLSTPISLARAYRCYLLGLGLGIPIVVLATMIHQFGRIEEKGITSWDEALDLTVNTKKVGTVRWFFGILLGILAPISLSIMDRALMLSL